MGIFGFGDSYNVTDLNRFYATYAQFIPKGTKPEDYIINGAEESAQYIAGEANLDLQMAYPITYPQKIAFFQTPSNTLFGGLANDFLDAVDASYCTFDGGDDPDYDYIYPLFGGGFQGPAMCGTYNVTNVVSVSYGKDESQVSAHYLHRQCQEWMKLALQGVTVLAAAGDHGVAGGFGCSAPPKGSEAIVAFSALYPATCPYVTAVGATQVNFDGKTAQHAAVDDPVHSFYSGGEFTSPSPSLFPQKE